MVTPSSRRAKIQSVYIQFWHCYSVELQRFRSRLVVCYLSFIYAFSLRHDGVYFELIYVDSVFLRFISEVECYSLFGCFCA